jgi:3-hydroxyacyl-[acyl-carrier-protein] dehydratase
VRPDEFWVPGHIPGRPLFPGVLMIEAGAQLSSVLHRIRAGEERFLGFTRADEAVFRHTVVPGDTLYLIAQQVEFGKRRFVSKTQGIVGDKLVFEVTVTGMAF